MDPDKLARLIARYAEAKGGDIYDPHFREVAAQQFRSADRRKWPFADPATFWARRSGPRRLSRRISAGLMSL